MVSLIKLFQKSNKLKLPEARHPKEAGKTDDPSYYLNHRMLWHPTKNCYIFKDVLQALIDAEVLKLCLEQKKMTANKTATSPLQFGRDLPSAPTRVVSSREGNQEWTILILLTRKRRVLFLCLLLDERQCGSILTLSKANSEWLSQTESPKARLEHLLVMWWVSLEEKLRKMSRPRPIQKKRGPLLLLTQVHLPYQRLDPPSSTWNSMVNRW